MKVPSSVASWPERFSQRQIRTENCAEQENLRRTRNRAPYFVKSLAPHKSESASLPDLQTVIKEEAKRLGSTTAFVRELIDDHRTMFGLPSIQVEVLEADMKNLKIATPREYVRHLQALRYQTLLRPSPLSSCG
jgi:hypothetical protein